MDQALQVARDLHQERKEGFPDRQWSELTPDVVLWLAELALHHPQVSATVAAALPSSGVRWAMPWGTGSRRVASNGDVLGGTQELFGNQWEWWATGEGGVDAPTEDAARAEVDERLIAAGYTLLGAVYRRERVPCPCVVHGRPCETCMRCRGHGTVPVEDPPPTPCPMCNGHGFTMDDPLYMCPRCSGRGMSPFRDLAAEAERDMPGGAPCCTE